MIREDPVFETEEASEPLQPEIHGSQQKASLKSPGDFLFETEKRIKRDKI